MKTLPRIWIVQFKDENDKLGPAYAIAETEAQRAIDLLRSAQGIPATHTVWQALPHFVIVLNEPR